MNLNRLDYINIKEVTDIINKFYYIDKIHGIDNSLEQVISLENWDSSYVNCQEKEIKLDNILYNEKDLLDIFINKLFQSLSTEDYPERRKVYKFEGLKTKKEVKKLLHIIIGCADYIAHNGRIGPGNFVLLNPKYFYLFLEHNLLRDNQYIATIKVIPTNTLNMDKIIIGRKNNNSDLSDGMILFFNKETNRYCIEGVGNFNSQYHILEITSLQIERRKKLKEIENNKYKIREYKG